ncbi:MAG TPA: hypothetical protein VHB21_27025 [Minicystis sp.]|nr:hypothetical protein [Minicystis sp.]
MLAIATPVGCNAILGLGDYKDFCPPKGTGTPGDCIRDTGSGGAGTGGTNPTGMPCTTDAQCGDTGTDCASRKCDHGTCTTDDANRGTTCSDHGGQQCDGQGKCVECLSSTDCKSDTLCVTATCNDQNACATANTSAGSTCGDHGGSVCDGTGSCVECNSLGDCAPTGTVCATVVSCDAHKCTKHNADSGTACTDAGGNLCDGAGHCFGAALPGALGPEQRCVVTTRGALKCWGPNSSGTVGDGTTMPRELAVDVVGLDSGVVDVVGGEAHTCALVSGGVKCWGDNGSGQLGTGDGMSHLTPTAVPGLSSGVKMLAGPTTNGYDTCALLNDGTVKCWGDTVSGNSPTPITIAGFSGVKSIAVGDAHLCGIMADDTVECVGDNSSGQLGDNTTTPRSMPVPVVFLTDVAQIVAGEYHTCARDHSGVVSCWGDNSYGQIGANVAGHIDGPVMVGTATVATYIAAGNLHTCAALVNGSAQCWGYNYRGQLGNGNNTQQQYPSNVVNLSSSVLTMAGGDSVTCAALADGTLECWGQAPVGDGTSIDVNTPQSVIGL